MWLILENSNRVPGTGGYLETLHRRLWKFFHLEKCFVKMKCLGNPEVESRSRGTWRTNWKHNFIGSFCFLCVCLPLMLLSRSDSASIFLTGELIGPTSPQWSVSAWTSFSTPGDYRDNSNSSWVMCLSIPGHLSQRGYSKKRWVHKAALGLQGESVGQAVSLKMGAWTEHPPWLTCPDQALELPQWLCGKEIRFQSRRYRRQRFDP